MPTTGEGSKAIELTWNGGTERKSLVFNEIQHVREAKYGRSI